MAASGDSPSKTTAGTRESLQLWHLQRLLFLLDACLEKTMPCCTALSKQKKSSPPYQLQLWSRWLTLTNLQGKTFQAAQLTNERFFTLDHSSEIFFSYPPNWTFTKWSEGAKMELSKSIFYVEKCPNLSNFFFIEEYKFRPTFFAKNFFW